MEHEILGKLTPRNEAKDGYTGRYSYEGRDVGIDIECDGEAFDEIVVLAAEIIPDLTRYDGIAKNIISRDLLESYNSGWNEYDLTKDDGTTESVRKPKLSEDEFKNYFILDSVEFTGIGCVELNYKPNELFWGHSVFVISFDGTDFSEAKAQMFG